MEHKTAKQRLIDEAELLRKAWLVSMACIHDALRPEDFIEPVFKTMPTKMLREYVEALRDDFQQTFRSLSNIRTKKDFYKAAKWMATQYDRWESTDEAITLCTAQYFEDSFGELTAKSRMDIPPYCELFVQGTFGMAYRHPEYMLARDLEFNYHLFTECVELIKGSRGDPASTEWLPFAAENAQALARTVILSCFNLLDSFVSGLARGFVMTGENLDKSTRDKLLDNRRSLKGRLVLIPSTVAGRDCGLDVNKPPVAPLFGPIKQRRDAFVHCEPGRQETRTGYIKEAAFHDVSAEVVEEAVTLTSEIICHLWTFLHGRSRPTWWTFGQENSGKKSLRLVP